MDFEGERERTSGLSQSVSGFFFSPTYLVSCNGPCAPKEKLHRKEHIIIIIIIIIIMLRICTLPKSANQLDVVTRQAPVSSLPVSHLVHQHTSLCDVMKTNTSSRFESSQKVLVYS